MKHKHGRRWLRALGGWIFGLALFLAGLFSLQGQQTGKSVLVQVNQVQGTQPVLQAFVEDEFIVVLKKESRAGFRAVERGASRPQVNSPSLQGLIDRHGVGRFRRQFQTARTQPAGSNRPDLSGHYKVRVPRGSNLEAALADFANDPQVERVEKIGIHPLYLTPNDSFYSDQWNHRSPNGIDSDLAWNSQTGNGNVVVAILDTGVHYQHPDLAGNIWTNPGEIPGNGIDDDGNGYVDDVRGYDFMESATGASLFTCCDSDCSTADNDPDDNNGHGTHLAGIVAATTNNGFGVAGIAGGFSSGLPGSTSNGVKIMPLRIGWNGALLGLLCGNGLIRMDYAAEALHYVADQKARGINIAAVNASWGSSDTGGLGAAVDEVLASDVMIIHAAGNSAENSADFLGSKVGAMSVAATDQNGAGADFTNFGDYVEISAPGVDITSLWVGPDPNTAYYATLSGTSMAAPHASAVAALLESLNPGLTAAQKFSLMVGNTKPYVNDGRNLGSGILNANLALSAAGPATPNFLVSVSPGSRIVPVGNSATYDLTVTALSGFAGTVTLSADGLPLGAAASFSPVSILGSGVSLLTVTTGPGTPLGSYPITITANGGGLSHTVNVTLKVEIPGAAGFIKTDAGTQGTWKGVYGAEGYAIASHANNYPAYAQVSLSGQSEYTWAGSTIDIRALQKPAATDRIASTWVSMTNFSIDVNLTDGNWHQVGIYCVDYDNQNRSQRVDALDAISGNVLDTRSLSGFQNGRYLVWNLKGHVKIQLTTLNYNAVVSGIFFDLPAAPDFAVAASPSVQSVTSGGNTSYNVTVSSLAGFNGAVSFSASGLPSGASASFSPSSVMGSGASTMTVTTGLATPGGSYPITITGTNGSLSHPAVATLVVTVSVPAAAGFIKTDAGTQGTWKGVYGAEGYAIASHANNYPAYAQVSLSGQTEYTWAGSTTDIRALQKPAATDRIASTWVSMTNFSIDVNLTDGNWHQVGIYCVDYDNWNRSQRVDALDAISGNVLDTRSLSGFQNGRYLVWNLKGHVKIQLTTLNYNAVVSGIFFDSPAAPDFAVAASPSVQSVTSGGNTSYNVTVSSLAGFNGAVSFSASGLPSGASASFSPSSVMGSGASTMTVTTGLATPGGSYPITITGTNGSLSHPAVATLVVTVSVPAAAGFIKTDAGTQGTWKGVYGAEGYAIASHANNYPAYAQVSLSGQTEYTWAGSTTDIRALQKPAATDRIASTWVSMTNFSIDVNLTDGNWHQVGIYCVDYDNWNRSQRVDALDAISGNVLDTRSLSGFQNGRYLVWNLKGHVKIQLTTLNYNAVVSGIFFDSPTPAITSFSPGGGDIGAAVTIFGTGLTNASKVTFNTTDQTVLTVVSDAQITTTVPAGATSGAIHVTTPGGTATSSGSFTVMTTPTITSFNPSSGKIGDSVLITGTNLTGATVVTFNTTNATVFTVNTSTQITASVPAGATTGTIKVTTSGGTATSSGSFTVVPAAPTGLTATAGNGQISLSWTSVSGASSYNVKRSTTNGGPYTIIASPASAGYLNTGLTNGVTYYYVVSAVNASGESSNSSQVSATPVAPNLAPAVNAGSDQTISLPNTATLNGSVIDDGLPSNTLTITWSTVSGPGTVTFGNPNAAVTTASFSAAGSYVLRLTGNDGSLSNSDDAIITVTDLIFANGFESGNLSFWSSSATDGGNLSVSAGARLVGNFGMQALINDNNPIYVTDESPTAESRYRVRFYFHPNAIPMNNGNAHYILQGLNSSGTVVLQVEFRLSGGQYQLRASLLNDSTGFSNTSWFSITNASHSVELDWRASTAPGANNGGLTFWTDGVQRANLSAVDNDTRRIERVRLGAVSGIDNGTRGTYYFDAFESRRTTYIGPVVP